MRTNIFSLSAIAAVVAGCVACETGPNGSMADGESVSVGESSAPGTDGDFKANVKDRVFFAFNSNDITDESSKTLEAQSTWLKTYPSTNALVAGHCDYIGTREYNLALGARRAESAKKALASFGIEAARLSTISYGKDQPIVEGKTDEARAHNRVSITHIQAPEIDGASDDAAADAAPMA
jgi:peptidoglycan-associated lipoprotein